MAVVYLLYKNVCGDTGLPSGAIYLCSTIKILTFSKGHSAYSHTVALFLCSIICVSDDQLIDRVVLLSKRLTLLCVLNSGEICEPHYDTLVEFKFSKSMILLKVAT